MTNTLKLNNGLKVIQANILHCKLASSTLCRRFRRKNLDFALIQEPYVNKKRFVEWNKLKGTMFTDLSAIKVRTCIFVKSDPSYTAVAVPKFCNQDLTTVRVNYDHDGQPKTAILASAYLPYEERSPPAPIFQSLISYCKNENFELIIGCDSNAHHTIWGSTNINPRGKSLSEYLSSTDLIIKNRGNTPTFVNRIRKEIIDITLASQTISRDIQNWRVDPEVTFSDHKWITFDIKSDIVQPNVFRNPRNTNWESYREQLNALTDLDPKDIMSTKDIDAACNDLNAIIMQSYEVSCPLSRPPPPGKSPGWTSELTELKNRSRKTFNKAYNSKRLPQLEQDILWDIHHKAKAEYKKAIDNKNRKAWKNFTEEVEVCKPMAKLKAALAKDPFQPELLCNENGESTTSSEEALNLLLEKHFPGIETNNLTRSIPKNRKRKPNYKDWQTARRLITVDRVKWAIKSFKPFKSPGIDQILPVLIIESRDILIPTLVKLLQASLAHGYIPKTWQEVKVIFIPKPGKSTYSVADAYRPISLTSILLKIMERVLDRYIRDEPLKHKPLHNKQHAYIAGKSVDSAIHNVVERIEKALAVKEHALGAFLDIVGAFNLICYESIKRAAKHFKVNETVITWIDTMLSSRKVKANFLNSSKTGEVNKGCPQGGVLSPILWNMVIDDLLNKLNKAGYNTEGFADDIVILLIGKFEETLNSMMKSALIIVEKWCTENGLSVNPQKTKLVLFTNKRKIKKLNLPKLNGTKLVLANHVKFLGFILDKKLNWRQHIEERINKATKIYWQCRIAFGKTWGLKPKVVRWLYTAIIRPILFYGSNVWHHMTKINRVKMDLEHVQRMVLMGITGVMKSTPTKALEVLMSILPVDLFTEQEAMVTAIRLKNANCWKDSTNGHSTILNLYKEIIPELTMQSDKCTPQYIFDKNFKVTIPQRNLWEENNPLSFEDINIFTDGSKMETGSGIGIFSMNPNIEISKPLDTYTTITQAETFAIIEACNVLTKENTTDKRINIFSDSQASLKALDRHCVTSKLTMECMQTIRKLSSSNDVNLTWVPGHNDVAGNEAADSLARAGSEAQFCGPSPTFGLTYTTQRTIIRNFYKTKHFNLWKGLQNCRHSRSIINGPNEKNTKFLLNKSRTDLRLIIGTITGHCKLNKHMQRMNLTQSATCRRCNEEDETPLHLITECPALITERAKIFNTRIMTTENIKNAKLEDILKFIKEIGIVDST